MYFVFLCLYKSDTASSVVFLICQGSTSGSSSIYQKHKSGGKANLALAKGTMDKSATHRLESSQIYLTGF